MPFPDDGEIVYVILYKRKNSGNFTPLYVGQSTRNIGRFGDYVKANFRAPTDFKVGRTVKLLRNAGCDIIIRYTASNEHKVEEKALIKKYRSRGITLLNDFPGYNYKFSSEENEEIRLRDFVSALLI